MNKDKDVHLDLLVFTSLLTTTLLKKHIQASLL